MLSHMSDLSKDLGEFLLNGSEFVVQSLTLLVVSLQGLLNVVALPNEALAHLEALLCALLDHVLAVEEVLEHELGFFLHLHHFFLPGLHCLLDEVRSVVAHLGTHRVILFLRVLERALLG